MRVVITGATGLVGRRLVYALRERGDDIVVLARDAPRAAAEFELPAFGWEPTTGPAPAEALAGADAVAHLAGEPIAQRWTAAAKERIVSSRVLGTRNLLAAIAALPAAERPRTLVSASACGYYGPRGDEIVTEADEAGDGFLAGVCTRWEREARAATELGLRVCRIRTGIVLDPTGGALAKLLGPFRLGLGGPVAGGRQWLPWIHRDDLTGLYLRALDDEAWDEAVNASAPAPVTNGAFATALGRALHRPAVIPTPAPVLRLLYGEMAETLTTGQRALPRVALDAGHRFAQPEIAGALGDLLSGAAEASP